MKDNSMFSLNCKIYIDNNKYLSKVSNTNSP